MKVKIRTNSKELSKWVKENLKSIEIWRGRDCVEASIYWKEKRWFEFRGSYAHYAESVAFDIGPQDNELEEMQVELIPEDDLEKEILLQTDLRFDIDFEKYSIHIAVFNPIMRLFSKLNPEDVEVVTELPEPLVCCVACTNCTEVKDKNKGKWNKWFCLRCKRKPDIACLEEGHQLLCDECLEKLIKSFLIFSYDEEGSSCSGVFAGSGV